jgi:hypothetical protein
LRREIGNRTAIKDLLTLEVGAGMSP